MYGIPDRLKALSAAEEQVLLALWDCKPPVSRRDIGARLAEKGWAAATVLNFLYRLEEKGWVKMCIRDSRYTAGRGDLIFHLFITIVEIDVWHLVIVKLAVFSLSLIHI